MWCHWLSIAMAIQLSSHPKEGTTMSPENTLMFPICLQWGDFFFFHGLYFWERYTMGPATFCSVLTHRLATSIAHKDILQFRPDAASFALEITSVCCHGTNRNLLSAEHIRAHQDLSVRVSSVSKGRAGITGPTVFPAEVHHFASFHY